MQAIDRIYLEEPTYCSRRMLDELQLLGCRLGCDRVRRLMRIMGIEPIYPTPHDEFPPLRSSLHSGLAALREDGLYEAKDAVLNQHQNQPISTV
jgi:hypothetical protein